MVVFQALVWPGGASGCGDGSGVHGECVAAHHIGEGPRGDAGPCS